MNTCAYLCLYSAEFFLESKMFEINVVEQIKIHSLCSVTFFPPENRAVYEIMCKNVVEPERPQMTI
jgi:hypothetical protein